MNQALMHKAQDNNNFFGVLSSNIKALPTTAGAKVDKKASNDKGYSHLVTTQDSLSESFELIKILRSHQYSGRWTVLIAPQNIPDKALLQCCSVDMGKVLVVHARQNTDVLATVENALSQSTCSAVVAWSELLPQQNFKQLSQLAAKSNCHFYSFNRLPGWTAA